MKIKEVKSSITDLFCPTNFEEQPVEYIKNTLQERLRVVRLYPDSVDKIFSTAEKSFNVLYIENELRLERKINTIAKKEFKSLYSLNDESIDYFKMIVKVLTSTYKNILREILTTEYHYFNIYITNTKDYYGKSKIEGRFLGYNIKQKKIYFRLNKIETLIININFLNTVLSTLLEKNHWTWLYEYVQLSREKELGRNVTNGKNKSLKFNRGKRKKFTTEKDFHSAIKKLDNWKILLQNKSTLAKALGYKSSSGLNDLLKSNNWNLPHGN